MYESAHAGLIAFLEESIRLCNRWEELVEAQFSAVSEGDYASLDGIQADQMYLAQHFSQILQRCQTISSHLPAGQDDEASQEWLADARALRQALADISLRIFGLNYRNVRAMTALEQLGAALEHALADGEQTYDRCGGLSHENATLRAGLDRSG